MRGQQINHATGKILIVLSLTALLAVLIGYTQPPQPDEGTGAHFFQLSIVALVLMILLFLATADWRQPLQSARPLAFPVAVLVLAFGALYYLEHYRQTATGALIRRTITPPPTYQLRDSRRKLKMSRLCRLEYADRQRQSYNSAASRTIGDPRPPAMRLGNCIHKGKS